MKLGAFVVPHDPYTPRVFPPYEDPTFILKDFPPLSRFSTSIPPFHNSSLLLADSATSPLLGTISEHVPLKLFSNVPNDQDTIDISSIRRANVSV